MIRIFPTKEQEQTILQYQGAYRFVWNQLRELQRISLAHDEKHLTTFEEMFFLKTLKENNPWLNDISHYVLQSACLDFSTELIPFLRDEADFPKFKSRKKHDSACEFVWTWIRDNSDKILICNIGIIKCKYNPDEPISEVTQHSRIDQIDNAWYILQ